MGRAICQDFLKELTSGTLRELLTIIQRDDTLMLELRGKSITVYYRGGRLLEITESRGGYKFKHGDKRYNRENIALPEVIISSKACYTASLEEYIMRFKHCIDTYFGGIRCRERVRSRFSIENEIRQHIVRENNYTADASETDYFAIDTEYTTSRGKKFDIVAIEWLANAGDRKLQRGYRPRLVIFELKYGGKAVGGRCGLSDHLGDFEEFYEDSSEVEAFKRDMLEVLRQKRELGMIPYLRDVNSNDIEEFADDIDFIFLMANYKSESSKLKAEIEKMGRFKTIEANHLGYGLYKHTLRCIECIDDIDKLLR